MKTDYNSILKPLNSDFKTFDFVGFDIETYNVCDTQEFYFGTIYYYNNKNIITETYFDKDLMIKRLLTEKFKNKLIVATNLSFDYSSLFYDTPYFNDIKLIWRGSDLITAIYQLKNKKGKVRFIDTFNYVGFSVEKLGKIINIQKMDKPEYIGKRKSMTKKELLYFIDYNIIDCKVSCDFMYFLQNGINTLGGELKLTIASSSLDTYRRRYMIGNLYKESYTLQDDSIKDFIHKGYYGGRCEVFEKGIKYNMKYYDINSLYPSQMIKILPNPNTVFKPNNYSIDNIIKYMGVSEVTIKSPNYLKYPILPYKDKVTKKLIFPLGTFRGVFNHNELNYAIVNGYEVLKIHKQICYKNGYYPFKDYINILYFKRLDYKKDNSNMELVVKLLMNSLYGKFAQSKRSETTITDINFLNGIEKEKALLFDDGDIKNNFLINSVEKEFNGNFTFPILSSYITSYARITLHKYIEKYNAIYCDTDSIITSEYIEDSKKLGEMKLECNLVECQFIKPKTYYMKDDKCKISVKMKGINRPNYEDYNKIMNNEKVNKTKFTKIRESIIRKLKPNTQIKIDKSINLQDDKRIWNKNLSSPIIINEK